MTALSFIDPELLPIEVLHCGNSDFRTFLRKIVENIKIFCSYRTSNAEDAETHILVHYRQFQLYAAGVTRIQGVVLLRIS